MNKEDFKNIALTKFEGKARELVINQINIFYECVEKEEPVKHEYKLGDDVFLKAHTFLHGTFRNIEGLKDIVSTGLIASYFIDGRISKYPSSVGVWNLKKDYYLKDYINFYSGGTIRYNDMDSNRTKTQIIPYNEMSNVMSIIKTEGFHRWYMEQTKEARFLPSLIQDIVQIGIIFNNKSEYMKEFLKGDILSTSIDDDTVKPLVNEHHYETFIKTRINKDDFFTDRESALLFGIPANMIEGILVGRIYEKDNQVLEEIKRILPNVYICNLDGKVIVI